MYYRLPIINFLTNNFNKVIIFHSNKTSKKIKLNHDKIIQIKKNFIYFFNKYIYYHLGTITSVKSINPDVILTWASTRNISTYILLVYCHFKNIPVFLHGHGFFKSNNILKKITVKYFFIKLCTRYICYNNLVKQSFSKNGISKKKLCTLNNTLYLKFTNNYKNKTGKERGVLFIGRLRDRTGIEILISSIQLIQNKHKIILHVIGDGKYLKYFKKKYFKLNWVKWHGEIYCEKKIKNISKECRIGAYLGHSGLSIVHYLGLSLPVLLKKTLIDHEGPENYYCNKANSFRVNEKDLKEVSTKLLYVWNLQNSTIKRYYKNSFNTYLKLSSKKNLEKFINRTLLKKNI